MIPFFTNFLIRTLAWRTILGEESPVTHLLRAVGMSRRQLRSMVRLESVAIAVLGAVLGVGLGLVFGVSIQQALADMPPDERAAVRARVDAAVAAGRLEVSPPLEVTPP